MCAKVISTKIYLKRQCSYEVIHTQFCAKPETISPDLHVTHSHPHDIVFYAQSSSTSRSSCPSHSDTLPYCTKALLCPTRDILLHKMVEPLLRYQASLESVLDFAVTSLLSSSERIQASSVFATIIDYYNSYERSLPPVRQKSYNRGKLLQLVYEYAISDHGQDNILVYFLVSISASPTESLGPLQEFSRVLANLVGFEDKSEEEKDQTAQRVQELADHLVDYFFLPFKGLSTKTPQPSPHLSAPLQQDDDILVGTSERLSSLRGKCLIRDRHRCMISR